MRNKKMKILFIGLYIGYLSCGLSVINRCVSDMYNGICISIIFLFLSFIIFKTFIKLNYPNL